MPKKNPSAADQKKADALADLSWEILESFFSKKGKKRPPVYLYLSPQSKGSLRNRSQEEVEWVHWQQARDGGISLRSPPAAWVAHLEQIPEEVAHLFALVYQKQKGPRTDSLLSEASYTCLHEFLGRFAQSLVFGPEEKNFRRSRRKLSENSFWDLSHEEGYALGDRWAKLYLEAGEESLREELQKFFQMNWYDEKNQKKILGKLYSRVGMEAHPDFHLSQKV